MEWPTNMALKVALASKYCLMEISNGKCCLMDRALFKKGHWTFGLLDIWTFGHWQTMSTGLWTLDTDGHNDDDDLKSVLEAHKAPPAEQVIV